MENKNQLKKEKNFSFRLDKSMLDEMNLYTEINWAGLLRNHIQAVLEEKKQK